MVEAVNSDFELQLRDKRTIVNNALRELLTQYVEVDSDLKEAIKYTLEAPGKRIRSALVLWCCEVVSPPGRINRDAEVAAAAKVGLLLLTHISSRYPDPGVLLEQAKLVFPNTKVAEDLMEIEVLL